LNLTAATPIDTTATTAMVQRIRVRISQSLRWQCQIHFSFDGE
jgi:hypothetical protein